jgi:hypothetical protein
MQTCRHHILSVRPQKTLDNTLYLEKEIGDSRKPVLTRLTPQRYLGEPFLIIRLAGWLSETRRGHTVYK